MTAQTNTKNSSSYGSPENWAQIIKGAGEGSTSAMQSASNLANTKVEAKEAKRRTLAGLLQQALKRKRSLSRVGQEYSDDMNDFQSQSLQNVARGFVEALQGSTGRM